MPATGSPITCLNAGSIGTAGFVPMPADLAGGRAPRPEAAKHPGQRPQDGRTFLRCGPAEADHDHHAQDHQRPDNDHGNRHAVDHLKTILEQRRRGLIRAGGLCYLGETH